MAGLSQCMYDVQMVRECSVGNKNIQSSNHWQHKENVIQAHFFASYLAESFFASLKQCGFWFFPMMNGCLSPVRETVYSAVTCSLDFLLPVFFLIQHNGLTKYDTKVVASFISVPNLRSNIALLQFWPLAGSVLFVGVISLAMKYLVAK